jgi:hypothetical protein
VYSTDIKIVGAVTDQNAVEEIEDIAKVFAYEQHMKGYTLPLHTQHLSKKVAKIPMKKPLHETKLLHTIELHILVKGLC